MSTSSTRRWGSMDVTGMLKHLHLSGLMALGEMEVPSANKRVFHVFPLKHLLLYVVPFPKGAPTAPKLKPTDAASMRRTRGGAGADRAYWNGAKRRRGTGSSAVWTADVARMGRSCTNTPIII